MESDEQLLKLDALEAEKRAKAIIQDAYPKLIIRVHSVEVNNVNERATWFVDGSLSQLSFFGSKWWSWRIRLDDLTSKIISKWIGQYPMSFLGVLEWNRLKANVCRRP